MEVLVVVLIGSTLWRAVLGVDLGLGRGRRRQRPAASEPRPWHPSMGLSDR